VNILQYTPAFTGNLEMRHKSIFKQTPLIRIIYLKELFSKRCIHYGQIDIKGSSEHRNTNCKEEDLKIN
jgi:hypothetical protein